ncbi:MAG: TetR/AcrR family transcriptional regulator, partial [Candidatus Heimdallarchaeota archaeon]|nr:TetR/AcrR family transcriptional regulator [Candidatus Heimdallarchaeota archaeon]
MAELKEVKKEYTTKEKILRQGLKLIQTKGYNGFSFKDIAEIIGIRKASVHHHFKSKELLGVQAIEYYRNKLIDRAEELLSSNIPTTHKLDAYFDFFLYWHIHGKRVCPAGVLTA